MVLAGAGAEDADEGTTVLVDDEAEDVAGEDDEDWTGDAMVPEAELFGVLDNEDVDDVDVALDDTAEVVDLTTVAEDERATEVDAEPVEEDDTTNRLLDETMTVVPAVPFTLAARKAADVEGVPEAVVERFDATDGEPDDGTARAELEIEGDVNVTDVFDAKVDVALRALVDTDMSEPVAVEALRAEADRLAAEDERLGPESVDDDNATVAFDGDADVALRTELETGREELETEVEPETVDARSEEDELVNTATADAVDELTAASPLLRYSAMVFHWPQFCEALPGQDAAQN